MLFDRAGIQMVGEAHRVDGGVSEGVVVPGAWSCGEQEVVRGRAARRGVSGSKSVSAARALVAVVRERVGRGASRDHPNS